jgi:hypothetical protein
MQTDPSIPDPPERKRRRFQFSLRTLLIVFTVCAAWLAWHANRAHRQRTAVNAVIELGQSLT